MPDLDAKIRAKLSPVYDPPWAVKQYRAALAAVLDRRARLETGTGWGSSEPGGYGALDGVCSACGRPEEYAVLWPCDELKAIAQALGIEVES